MFLTEGAKTYILRFCNSRCLLYGIHSAVVTTQADRLKVDRLKEKTCAITQSQDRVDTPACAAAAGRSAGDCVMDDHYCPSAFSLQPKHLSSYLLFTIGGAW
jgi:hypothetical protein